MNALLIEPIGGASGNMLLGAFFDLGLPFHSTLDFLKSLELGAWEFEQRQVIKVGITAQWCDFKIAPEQHGPFVGPVSNEQLQNWCLRLPKQMQSKASLVLERLTTAEGAASPTRSARAAIDLCLDVFGFIHCWSQLDYCPIWVTALPLGQGLSRYHGQLWPNPSPVVTSLLHGFPQYRLPIQQETITATGAALLSSLASPLAAEPFVVHQTGYGAGQSDFPMSNVVRLSKVQVQGQVSASSDLQLVQVDCDLDDMTGEQLANLTDRVIAAGAIDAQLIAFLGKKGRPGHRLSFLVGTEQLELAGQTLFKYSTTLGYRWHPVQRTVLERHSEVIESSYGPVSRKVAQLPDGTTRWKWEHVDLQRLTKEHGLSEIQISQSLLE